MEKKDIKKPELSIKEKLDILDRITGILSDMSDEEIDRIKEERLLSK